eukprot:PITA_10382
MSNVVNIVEPTNYKEASQFKEWRAVMNEEMESILRNDTWDLVELPKNKTPIGCKWLFKPKMNADGSIKKLKARPVEKGYSQQEGIDFDDTFSPVAKLNKIRMLIALATKYDMIITGDADDLIRGIKRIMAQVFEMKYLGCLHYCLGLEVCRDTGPTFLTQGKYARNLLEKFGMDQCRSAVTPLQQNLKLRGDDGTK